MQLQLEKGEYVGSETPTSNVALALEGAEPISADAVDKGPKEEQAAQVCHLLQQLSRTVRRPNLATCVVLFLSAVEQRPYDSTSLHTRLADDSLMIMCLLTCRVSAGAPK